MENKHDTTTAQSFDPSKPYINLTAEAEKHLQQYLSANPQAKGLRLTTKKTGCSGYMYISELATELTEKDLPVENQSALPIFMTNHSLALLNGLTIDYQTQSLGQSKLIYINPNETAKCGCGESFGVDQEKRT